MSEDRATGAGTRRVAILGGLALGAAAIAVLIAVHPGPLSEFVPWIAGSNNIVGTQTFIPARGFTSQQALQEHFNRDGAAFAATSPAAYDTLARAFFQNRSLWEQSNVGSTIRLYDPQTNTFGTYTSHGVTLSFFKPAAGAAYWAEVSKQRG